VAERLILVGMMGVGKTTVGRQAAKRLGWTWVDIDSEVAREANSSVADLFARHGEAHFRREESRALKAVLSRDEPLVISVGGGAVLEEDNRNTLRTAGTVVWLRARPETLMARVHDVASRPLLVGDTPEARTETLRRLDSERRNLYDEVADTVIDVDHLSTQKVVERLLHTAGVSAPDRQAHA
jgi:shikimate kinase